MKQYDFENFSVQLQKNAIFFTFYKNGEEVIQSPNTLFEITVDEAGIEIKHLGNSGDQMTFKCINDATLKGMFEFIARAYCIQLPEAKSELTAIDFLVKSVESLYFIPLTKSNAWDLAKKQAREVFKNQIAKAHEDGIPDNQKVIGALAGTYPQGYAYYTKIFEPCTKNT